ncbi:type IV pilus biogenesis/stability protein PilW [Cognatilysobacter terrigena]|uniref:type IV pilus biogenesis/stability protein PilW n=1 Tax=Cognatilysobacter terrigena TaxID=2488749 RepID=UPI001061DFD5|nr:type IV pilus biogenesis/stability protein PilW [Lysobacter terrigena]
MPQRKVVRTSTVVLLLGSVLLASACSRLTFVRQDTSRGKYEQIAPEVHIDPKNNARDTAYTMTQVAQSRLMSGNTQGAVDAAERALKADPNSAEAHSLLALGLDALGRPRESGPHHRRAAELAPERGALLNNYGIWLCSNGQAAASLDWFDRAANATGYDTPDAALANGAACALQAGEGIRAERNARQALAAVPTNPLALQTLARIEFNAGHGLEARAFIQRRLAAAAADQETLQLASQIEQSLGDTAAAARYVQRMRTEFPPDSRPVGEK